MSDIDDRVFQSPSRLRAELLSRENLNVRDVIEKSLARIEKKDDTLNAFRTVFREKVLRRADRLDRQRKEGKDPGPLTGVPVAVKDNICIKDHVTTAGSKMLEDWAPPYTATVVERLKEAGALIVGKTNMDEFAMGSSGENSAFGPTKNPHDTNRVPGGSSSGSAAAVSAGMVTAALGSDTGGSVRQPAALCGLTGFKPAYGRVSRYGLIAFASSLEGIGILANDPRDAMNIYGVIAGDDAKDATCSGEQEIHAMEERMQNANTEDLVIGIPKEYMEDRANEEVVAICREVCSSLERTGPEIRSISLPHTEYALPAYYVIASSEASSNLARFDGTLFGKTERKEGDGYREVARNTRENGFGREVKRRIQMGTFALSSGYRDAYYKRACKVRRLIAEDFRNAFEEVDLIAGPTSPIPAFPLGERTDDPLEMYQCDQWTVPANLAGLPAVSVHCGYTDQHLPVGLQLLAPEEGVPEMMAVGSILNKKSSSTFEGGHPDSTRNHMQNPDAGRRES